MYLKKNPLVPTAACVAWVLMFAFAPGGMSMSASDVIFLLLSSMFLILGCVVFMGGVILLAGVNAMPREEREKYDMDALAHIAGIGIIAAALSMFPVRFAAVALGVGELSTLPEMIAVASIVLASAFFGGRAAMPPEG
ncbi:MAG: DUF3784 domain-containing protein [Candidatus Methanoplasma sp.]|jgi:hypothetical protein|nr:DUF3784 domain-containing protein [Candidatus Methanoplasma sp.]